MGRRFLTITAALAVLATGGLLSQTTAHADLTANQLAMYDDAGNTGMVCLYGTNQNNQPVPQPGGQPPCWLTTGWQTDFYNYWWKSATYVTVYEYNFSGALQRIGNIYMAPAYPQYNWICFYATTPTANWQC